MTLARNSLGTLCLSLLVLAGCSSGEKSPASTAAGGPPDLSGPWQISNTPTALTTSDGKQPPLTEEGKKLYADNQAAKTKGDKTYDSINKCVPPGIPRLAMQPFPFDIVQGPRHVAIMHEWNHLPRTIYMAEGHFDGIGPTYLGQSVGKYEGDTLVVDTNQFNDQTLLDDSGLPHSDELVTVERYRLIDDGKRLELRVTITDPKIFTQPWETTLTFDKSPAGTIVKEDYCFRRTGIVK
ncbi:MAG: hypothetical protein QM808_03985 [Steroidobacteraceae bacterium]